MKWLSDKILETLGHIFLDRWNYVFFFFTWCFPRPPTAAAPVATPPAVPVATPPAAPVAPTPAVTPAVTPAAPVMAEVGVKTAKAVIVSCPNRSKHEQWKKHLVTSCLGCIGGLYHPFVIGYINVYYIPL